MSFLQPNQEMKLQPPGPLHLASHHEKDIPFPSSSEDLARSRRERAAVDTEFFAAVDQARASVRADARWNAALTEVSDNITVTTLGTGSAIPSKYRNVSSTHLDIPDFGGILLDAGEGTLGQLRRKFGMAGMQDFYNNLKIVHISHMHADHHLGLQSILHDRFKVSRSSATPLMLDSMVWRRHCILWHRCLSPSACRNPGRGFTVYHKKPWTMSFGSPTRRWQLVDCQVWRCRLRQRLPTMQVQAFSPMRYHPRPRFQGSLRPSQMEPAGGRKQISWLIAH